MKNLMKHLKHAFLLSASLCLFQAGAYCAPGAGSAEEALRIVGSNARQELNAIAQSLPGEGSGNDSLIHLEETVSWVEDEQGEFEGGAKLASTSILTCRST